MLTSSQRGFFRGRRASGVSAGGAISSKSGFNGRFAPFDF